MFIYLIYTVGLINIILLFNYLVKAVQAKRRNIDKQQVSEKLIERLKG